MNIAGAAMMTASFMAGASVGAYAVWKLWIEYLQDLLNDAETKADENAAECVELRRMLTGNGPVSIHYDEPMGSVYQGVGFIEGFYPDGKDESQAWERPAGECKL